MIRIDAIQPDSVPISFPGAESDRPKAGGASPSGGNRSGSNAAAPGDGDTVTLSAEALAALAVLSSETTEDPQALQDTPLPPEMQPADAEDAPPDPTNQIPSAIIDAAQADMEAAVLTMGANEGMPTPAIWGRAYERTLMSAPDHAAPTPAQTRTAPPPGPGQTDSATPDTAENTILANDVERALTERLLNSGLDDDPGTHFLAGRPTDHAGNRPQTVTDPMVPDLSHDLTGSTDPESIAQNVQNLPQVDERMVAMYAPPMGNRPIREPAPEIDDTDPPPEPTGRVTGALLDAVAAWQGRRLNALYPVIFFDTLQVKVRDDSIVRDKPVHVVRGMHLDGTMDMLGLWLERHQTTGFGRHIMDALKRRGMEDILMAVAEGADGIPAAIHAAFPQALVHPSIAHLLHHLPNVMAVTDRVAMADSPWGQMLQSAAHTIAASNAMLGRAIQARGYFANDQAALAFLYLTLNSARAS
ncbi:transposase [Gluconacetobacter takamatsuzukensis]|uniref:Mutator family transposase n=1 Tax=Gluconacetobacter takamatsuzukensis TaxID=1286190 RepID=A0A7W4KCT4_9PROT|nr:transposase [Gluconacetobacter takamatsuzukensis]MBB2204582.1 hypothetical protein [Gluconacetobacter takamatsuzukensis]